MPTIVVWEGVIYYVPRESNVVLRHATAGWHGFDAGSGWRFNGDGG